MAIHLCHEDIIKSEKHGNIINSDVHVFPKIDDVKIFLHDNREDTM